MFKHCIVWSSRLRGVLKKILFRSTFWLCNNLRGSYDQSQVKSFFPVNFFSKKTHRSILLEPDLEHTSDKQPFDSDDNFSSNISYFKGQESFSELPPPLLQMIRLYNEMLLAGANYIYVEEFQ